MLPILQAPIDSELLRDTIFKAADKDLPELIDFLEAQPESFVGDFVGLLLEAKRVHEARTKGASNNLKGKVLEAYARGKTIYEGKAVCMACHGQDDAGLLNLGPPLANSEWVTGDPNRLIQILLHGMEGPIEVAGKTYNPPAVMPDLGANPTISNKDLANVVTYIRNAWGNNASGLERNTYLNNASSPPREMANSTELKTSSRISLGSKDYSPHRSLSS
ncbi:cytochrome c [Opitutia bacterium ISCC 51]|nr:cytochrome c [Opitutae bacterium ISCC 51]QXD30212.1 cytochrome c [Opitutae bacterium ISCC 52]